MSWLNVWDSLKNKTCRYLLQRYLGRFLDDQIRLEQLKIELYNGKAKIHNVTLNKETLNELFEAQGWAVEVIGGHIGELTVQIPWNALMTSNSSIEVANLKIDLRPTQRQHNDGTSMLESMWSSVSSTLQLAEECIKQDLEESATAIPSQAIDGLEKFAETIDNVLNRITAKFTNTLIRFEHQMPDGKRTIGLCINVKDFYYKNETGSEVRTTTTTTTTLGGNMTAGNNEGNENEQATENRHYVSTFAKHTIDFNGITISTEEFSNQQQTGGNKMKSIPIVDIRGQQKIIVRVKQSEEVSGPKILMDMELGAIYALFTPRQVHLALAFWSAFNDDEHNEHEKRERENAFNFGNFESNKKQFTTPHMTGVLGGGGGGGIGGAWGETVETIPLTKDVGGGADINLAMRRPATFRYCDSMYSSMSSCSQSTMTSTARFQRKLANMETCGEIVKFNVRIGQICLNLLHEDVLFESFYDGFLNESSVLNLLQIAEEYFENLPNDHTQATTNQNSAAAKALAEKCFINLRLTPIILDGIQQRNKQVLLFKLTASAAKFDLSEILKGAQTSLIAFDREENCSDGYHKRPELAISLKSTSCNIESLCDTIVDVTLEKCTIDLDISIYDRLSALLAPSQFDVADENGVQPACASTSNENDKNSSKSSTQLNIACNFLNLNLRFPIVDARPIHDPQREPWWKQNIRDDFLQIEFVQFRLNFTTTLLKIMMNEAEVFYCENNLNKIQLLKSSLTKSENKNEMNSLLNCPKISIALQTQSSISKTFVDPQACTVHKNLPFSSQHVCRQSETVHKRRDMAEAETILLPGDCDELKQFRDSAVKCALLHVQIMLPNVTMMLQSKQLYETIYNRINYNLFLWEPSSPLLNQCKQEMSSVYESLFNLNLSESIYKPSKAPANADLIEENENEFSSEIGDRDNDDAGESDDDTTSVLKNSRQREAASKSVYFSTHDNESRFGRKQFKVNENIKTNACCVELLVPKGALTVFVPVRDNEQHVLPEQSGRLDFHVEDFQLFAVSGYKENKNLDYVILQTKSVEMFHCGLVPEFCSKTLADIGDHMPEYMNATIYKLPLGLKKGGAGGSAKREMASVVIEVKKLPEQKIKRVRATAGIQTAALKHNTELAPHTWINQIIDFLDVQDAVVEGYKPSGVVTELQLHLWDWAIDYRPKNFTYRAVLEIGTFTISSNIISSINGCNLRFIVEEAVLSIGPYNPQTNCHKNVITVLPSKTLVPVLDLGLLDISLRLSEKSTNSCPKFDLRCSIHDGNLRTCADSGKALAQLIAYLASDGDFSSNEDYDDEASMPGSILTESDGSEILTNSKTQSTNVATVTEQQQERVEFMMAEAVQEPIKIKNNLKDDAAATMSTSSSSVVLKRGIEVFYFPDEASKTKAKATKPSSRKQKQQQLQLQPQQQQQQQLSKHDEEMESNNESCDILNFESSVMTNTYCATADLNEDTSLLVKQDLGDIIKVNAEQNSEDEFCFLSEDEKIFKNRETSTPQVSNEPLRIVDNHFQLPLDKPDLLKSPDNFPMAETRYTICEMTVTWHLYGGSDFPQENAAGERQQAKASNSRMSEAYKSGVAYSKSANNVKLLKDVKEKPSWKTAGGAQRDHQVLVEVHLSKVRLSYEIYPLTTSHASRQVFVVNEIEIRDRLQSSEINKFLYHPHVNSLANRSTQPMLVVKALHVRSGSSYDASQECSLRISLLPLRLHIDQDTLIFLAEYFTNLADTSTSSASTATAGAVAGGSGSVDDLKVASHRASSTSLNDKQSHSPIMTVEDIPVEAVQDLRARNMVSTNLELLMDNTSDREQQTQQAQQQKISKMEIETQSAPIYFREVIFSPEVTIRLDYHGRRVELSRGPIAGLLMGLGQLQCSEIRLRKLVYRRGLLGVDKLFMYLCKEWLKDIKKNQLPKILSGVGPTYAFVQLFQGIYDLFWMPFEQYQKDGRLIRGLQLGAQSFTARTALAALEITSRIIQLLQFTAETAFDLVSPGPSVRRHGRHLKGKKKRRPNRPKDIREGVTNAYLIVKEGINDSAANLIETAVIEHDQKGYTGAVGAVMRQIPQLVVCPAVLATQATTNILGGVKNSLVPEAKNEAREKWKGDD